MAEKMLAELGLIGLAVMGQSLALNTADRGFKAAIFNRTTQVWGTQRRQPGLRTEGLDT